MSDFRSDAAAAAEWVARYLEGVRELPVLSRVEPGRIKAALPDGPPERAEPFAAVRSSARIPGSLPEIAK